MPLVRSGDWIDYAAGILQPDLFDQALARRKDQLHGVKIRACASFSLRAVLEADPSDGHRHLTGTGGQLQFMRGA